MRRALYYSCIMPHLVYNCLVIWYTSIIANHLIYVKEYILFCASLYLRNYDYLSKLKLLFGSSFGWPTTGRPWDVLDSTLLLTHTDIHTHKLSHLCAWTNTRTHTICVSQVHLSYEVITIQLSVTNSHLKIIFYFMFLLHSISILKLYIFN